MISPFIFIIPIIILFPLFLFFFIGFSLFHLLMIAICFALGCLFLFVFFGIDILGHIFLFVNQTIETIQYHEELEEASIKQQREELQQKLSSNSSSIPEIQLAEQVFNIPANLFTYSDAKAVCSAYGARLATYTEVEDAYNRGGEWCNYGWSANQQILFPTQKETYDKLQGIKGHENDCGRQGINGGYIANPHARFGVNCFGYKPEMTTAEQQLMENASSPYPLNAEDLELQRKVDFFKKNQSNILISPFNSSYWSKLF